MMFVKGIICGTLWSQFRGLMFSKKKTLIFEFKRSSRINLHMFFVFFKINLYFLNENKEVIEIKKDFKPFTIYLSKKKARYVIESPNKLNLNVGNVVEWK
ncbi:DUF192 domain-containing protein [Candidatus Woesearchaeota archaeon]|nr:DUF192 domain-containing protein [Candidatus Woesearchaeota archaeon]